MGVSTTALRCFPPLFGRRARNDCAGGLVARRRATTGREGERFLREFGKNLARFLPLFLLRVGLQEVLSRVVESARRLVELTFTQDDFNAAFLDLFCDLYVRYT
jgi:hypothetical protein